MAHKIQKYGWKRDLPDHRDFIFSTPPVLTDALPSSVDLRDKCPPVFDQGQLGSCTANGCAGLCWFDELKEGHPSVEPSRLFIYYATRAIEGTVSHDAGASIRDAIKSVVLNGYPPEADWPYNISEFAVKPPTQAYNDAKKEVITQYHSVPQVPAQLKAALAQGFPIEFGFTVYESFESDAVAKTGIMLMPHAHESVLGGHAVVLVGYDDSKQWYIVRNSWGEGWGDKGYFYMPYKFAHNPRLASDFWVINAVP